MAQQPTQGSFDFNDIWDAGRGIFRDWLDFERFKFELDLAKAAQAGETQNEQNQAPAGAAESTLTNQLLKAAPLIALGLVGVFVLRRIL